MTVNEVVVRVDRLKSNMVLARDVVVESGYVLITRDTMLNAVLIDRLMELGVKSVVIKTMDYTVPAPQAEQKPVMPVVQQPEFKTFETAHVKKEIEASTSLKMISNGGAIDLGHLYDITDGVMNAIDSKSDIFSYLNFLKLKDDHTFSHCLNVSLLCNLFGRWIGLPFGELVDLTVAGLLHDIGKTKIDLAILNKPGKLTPEEYEIMKKHTTYGYRIVEPNRINDEIKKAVLMHHERMNGRGYPLGVNGYTIGRFSKIVAICDIYDAMTATRVYRDKMCPFDVIHTLERNMYGELDTEYLLMFLKNIAFTYMASQVILSDNRVAEVVYINTANLSRPLVKVGDQFIDLAKERNINILMLK